MSNHDELIQHFTAVSGADADRAKFFLESAAWDLSTALGSFYEEVGEDLGAAGVPAASVASSTEAATAAADPVPPAGRGVAGLVGAGGWPHTDSDDEGDDDEEEEGQAFYAGGSQHSGQQVLGPPRKKKDVVAKLFKAAKQHGAEVVTDTKGGPKTIKATFHGTSYRLGETPDDTEVILDAASSSSGRERSPQPVELRMWRTGFTIDDGPLRDYQDEESMRFLQDIKSGRIPMELLRSSGGREVAINMSDHHHEDYVPQKPARKAFTGSGQTLGSPAPSVVGVVTHVAGPGGSATKPPADPKQCEETAKKQLYVDEAQPTTNVQVRLSDGSRLVVRANHSHTVADLRLFVSTARPQYANAEFALMTTFPHAELTQHEHTLKEANLLGAAIVLKIK